jgi:anti-sigma-K factor RskA
MSNETHVTELLPAHALDCLEKDEAVMVAEHLAICPACRAEFAIYQDVADRLALAAPDADPPADLKRRLMAQIQPSPPIMPAEPRVPWLQTLANLMRRAAPVWGLASLILMVALAVSNLLLWQRINQQVDTPHPRVMHTLTLIGTDAAQNAIGTVVISMDGEHGALVVDGLSPLDKEHQYQLWLIQNGQRTSGGIFSVDADGYGVLWVSSPAPLSSYDAFGITIEPAGGSPGPTGDKVLGGTL